MDGAKHSCKLFTYLSVMFSCDADETGTTKTARKAIRFSPEAPIMFQWADSGQ